MYSQVRAVATNLFGKYPVDGLVVVVGYVDVVVDQSMISGPKKTVFSP